MKQENILEICQEMSGLNSCFYTQIWPDTLDFSEKLVKHNIQPLTHM